MCEMENFLFLLYPNCISSEKHTVGLKDKAKKVRDRSWWAFCLLKDLIFPLIFLKCRFVSVLSLLSAHFCLHIWSKLSSVESLPKSSPSIQLAGIGGKAWLGRFWGMAKHWQKSETLRLPLCRDLGK